MKEGWWWRGERWTRLWVRHGWCVQLGLKESGEAVEGAVLVRTAAVRRVARSGRALVLLILTLNTRKAT